MNKHGFAGIAFGCIILFCGAIFAAGPGRPGDSKPFAAVAEQTLKRIEPVHGGAARGLSTFDCSGGDIHDDGTAENTYGWPTTITDGRYVEKFTPSTYPFKYTDMCVCLSQVEKFVFFGAYVMYDDNGPGGSPGDQIFLLGTRSGIFDDFNSMPIEAHCPVIEGGSVYIGVQWDAKSALHSSVCADESVTTPINGGYAFDDVNGWRPIQDVHPNYRAMLIRAKGEEFIDCNNNGINDSREVSDGIPYAVDDGRAELVVSCCSDRDMMRLNQFVVLQGGEVIDRIAIAWGDQAEGTPVTVHIFRDPDNDPTNSPEDHILLASAAATVQNPLTDIFNDIPIGPVYVGEAGDSFSVAFLIENVGFGFPTYLDAHKVQHRSWEILWPGGTADVSDLTTGSNPNLEEDYNYTIRAIAVPVDCNSNAVPDECDLALGGGSEDCNQNTIPDECDTAPDQLAGDGLSCETPAVIEVPGNVLGSTAAQTRSEFLRCGLNFSLYGVWAQYRPASSGVAFFGFDAMSAPMMVNVFDGCPNSGGIQIACNSPNGFGVTFNVQRDHMYYIRWAAIGTGVATFEGHFVGPRSLESEHDFNDNGIPDECDCLFNVNGDSVVDLMDFLDARQNEGMCLSFPCLGDVDGDGFVDEQDYMLILNNLGPCPFPRAAALTAPKPTSRK